MIVSMIVSVISRNGCGSCLRVFGQVEKICAEEGVETRMVTITEDGGIIVDSAPTVSSSAPKNPVRTKNFVGIDLDDVAVEYGDRVPVVLIDGREHACWEIDEDDFRLALRARSM